VTSLGYSPTLQHPPLARSCWCSLEPITAGILPPSNDVPGFSKRQRSPPGGTQRLVAWFAHCATLRGIAFSLTPQAAFAFPTQLCVPDCGRRKCNPCVGRNLKTARKALSSVGLERHGPEPLQTTWSFDFQSMDKTESLHGITLLRHWQGLSGVAGDLAIARPQYPNRSPEEIPRSHEAVDAW